MTKRIEDIWQQGMRDDDSELLVYTRRKESDSHDLLQQLRNKYLANSKWMGFGAILSFCILPLLGFFILAFALGFTFLGVYLLSKAQIKELSTLDKALPCYEYLVAYRAYLQQAKTLYGKLYQVVYPTLYAALLVEFLSTDGGAYFMKELIAQGTPTLFNLPIEVLIFSVISTGIVAISAKALYFKEVKVFYGKEFAKLDALIAQLQQREA